LAGRRQKQTEDKDKGGDPGNNAQDGAKQLPEPLDSPLRGDPEWLPGISMSMGESSSLSSPLLASSLGTNKEDTSQSRCTVKDKTVQVFSSFEKVGL
jgi:hypothetical protein